MTTSYRLPASALVPALLTALVATLVPVAAHAAVADDLLRQYEAQARQDSPQFAGFSAERGAAFFRSTHGSDWSCATCHTAQPAATGTHARTRQTIQPLSPVANPARFTDAGKSEKWFNRNCRDVLGRACSAQEKGDVMAFLRTAR